MTSVHPVHKELAQNMDLCATQRLGGVHAVFDQSLAREGFKREDAMQMLVIEHPFRREPASIQGDRRAHHPTFLYRSLLKHLVVKLHQLHRVQCTNSREYPL